MTLAAAIPTTLEARATAWASLPDDELKRRAVVAANTRDCDTIWDLCAAYLTVNGAVREKVSRNTLRAYRRGVLDLLNAWQHENVLRPSRNAPQLFVIGLKLKDRDGNIVLDAEGKPVPLSPGTIAVKLAAAKLLYRTLAWAGATGVDPFKDVRAPKDNEPAWEKRKPYSAEEVQLLRAKARPVDYAIVLLGAHAGLRVNEMVDLRWRDIDFGDGTLKVQHGKGGKPRTVPMSPGLAQAIQRLPRVGDRVLGFTSTSRARARMRRLAFRALVPYRGIHALRHTCGTRLARERGLEAAQHHLGHANLATTQVYAKWSDTKSREAVEDWQ